jgi:hypothetical protein
MRERGNLEVKLDKTLPRRFFLVEVCAEEPRRAAQATHVHDGIARNEGA